MAQTQGTAPARYDRDYGDEHITKAAPGSPHFPIHEPIRGYSAKQAKVNAHNLSEELKRHRAEVPKARIASALACECGIELVRSRIDINGEFAGVALRCLNSNCRFFEQYFEEPTVFLKPFTL